MFRNFMEFFRGDEPLKLGVAEDSQERDLYVTAAILLTDHAMLDRDLTSDEMQNMVDIIESNFSLKRFMVYDSLEIADLAQKSPQRVDQLFEFVRENFSIEDRKFVLGLVWKAIVADEVIEEAEGDAARRMRERLGLSVEDAVAACLSAEEE